MQTSPARTEPSTCSGFTFPEILAAMLIACLTVYAATSALITILRLDDAGLRDLRTSLALHQTACRHFLPEKALPDTETPVSRYFVYPPLITTINPWVIYTLTPVDDSDSINTKLALMKRSY